MQTVTEQTTPSLYISGRAGAYSVILQGSPLCAPTDAASARRVYADARDRRGRWCMAEQAWAARDLREPLYYDGESFGDMPVA